MAVTLGWGDARGPHLLEKISVSAGYIDTCVTWIKQGRFQVFNVIESCNAGHVNFSEARRGLWVGTSAKRRSCHRSGSKILENVGAQASVHAVVAGCDERPAYCATALSGLHATVL